MLFLLSRSQTANLRIVLDLGAGSVAVKTPSGKRVVLAPGVRGGHLVSPFALEVRPGISEPRRLRGAMLRSASRKVLSRSRVVRSRFWRITWTLSQSARGPPVSKTLAKLGCAKFTRNCGMPPLITSGSGSCPVRTPGDGDKRA